MLKFANFSELDSYLRSIDNQMRKDGIPITGRPLQALSRISGQHNDIEFNISAAMDLTETEVVGFEGDALTKRIIDWFDTLYGDRLKVCYVSGKSVALVGGDPYRVNIPMALGDVDLIADSSKLGISGHVDQNGRTIVNVLDSYIGISSAAASLLTLSDKVRLINELRINTWRFHKIWKIEDYKNTLDVKIDIDSAVEHIMTGPSGYGLSRWHSLQAAEKALKSVISCQGLKFPRTHDLYKIMSEIKDFYIDPIFVELVNCQPDLRYDATTSTIGDAIKAHNASLAICCKAAMEVAERGFSV